MLYFKKHKKLIQAVALAFTMQCVGGSFAPVAFAADDAAANYEAARVSEETIKAALGAVIELKDEDDDLQYVNKLFTLMSDSTGKTTPFDNLSALISAAQEEKAAADKYGAEPSENVKSILSISDRLSKIAAAADSGTLSYTDGMKNNDIKIYQNALSELKTCNAKAEVDKKAGKEVTACAMTDAQKAAYQRLIANNSIVEAAKKATQQVNQTPSSSTTTNATDATKSTTSTTKQLSCYEGTVLSGDGKCCPTATPIYNKDAGVCVTATITTTPKKKSSDDSSDGMNKAMLWMLMNRNGDPGEMKLPGCWETGPAKKLPDGMDGTKDKRRAVNNKNQYSFNYTIQQNDNGSAITYLPVNSDDIKFIVYKSSPMQQLYNDIATAAKQAAASAQTANIVVNERLSIKVPAVFGMNNNDPSVLHYIEVPLKFGKWTDLFKDDLQAGIQWNYKNYTNLLRVPASTFNDSWQHYTATVVYTVSDNFKHSQSYQFYVPFDFTATSTRIGAAVDTSRADIEITPVTTDDKQTISVEGTIKSASWEEGKCSVNIEGTAIDDKTSETQENVTLPYSAGLSQKECEGLEAGAKVTLSGSEINGSTLSGGTIVSDSLGKVESTADNTISQNQTVTINGLPFGKIDVKIDEETGQTYIGRGGDDGRSLSDEDTELLNIMTDNDAYSYGMCNDYDTTICAYYADGSKETISSNDNAGTSLAEAKKSIGKTAAGVESGTLSGLPTIQKISEQNSSVVKTAKSIAEKATKTVKDAIKKVVA